MKKLWKIIAAIAGAIGTILLVVFTGKPPRHTPGADIIASTDKLHADIKDIQSKTDDEIIKDHVTPAQKENSSAIVSEQVAKAIAAAAKYKRSKTP